MVCIKVEVTPSIPKMFSLKYVVASSATPPTLTVAASVKDGREVGTEKLGMLKPGGIENPDGIEKLAMGGSEVGSEVGTGGNEVMIGSMRVTAVTPFKAGTRCVSTSKQ